MSRVFLIASHLGAVVCAMHGLQAMVFEADINDATRSYIRAIFCGVMSLLFHAFSTEKPNAESEAD